MRRLMPSKRDPKYWAYVQAMPRERLERSVVLNEVRELDRQRASAKACSSRSIVTRVETRLRPSRERPPRRTRRNVIAQIARTARRTIARTQGNSSRPAAKRLGFDPPVSTASAHGSLSNGRLPCFSLGVTECIHLLPTAYIL